MNRTALALLLTLTGIVSVARASDPFMKPTAEELAMKELPGYPGAPAVVLFYEEISKDDINVIQRYERIKILTEKGKDYANVDLKYVHTEDTGRFISNEMTVGDIVGRTIHADGTVIPFTGKPYLKTIEKTKDYKYQSMVFTLPDVEVGSIIEYRYSQRYADREALAPDWYIQREIYVKAAHFQWYPTIKRLVDDKERSITTITWFPILPPGVEVKHTELPLANGLQSSPQQEYDLVVKDVPPQPEEPYMPPIASYSYRVLFNFTAFRTYQDYWTSEGKEWSKSRDAFAGPNGDLKTATAAIVAGAGSPEEKLHRIYAAVMALENTNYTRDREKQEDKASGVGKVNTAADVLRLKRGSALQLTELFVGMARAAGLNAYMMLVPDRSEELFTPQWLSFRQFDATIAIVNVGGKDVYFDPGSRYSPYGQVAWQHTLVRGLRQSEKGTEFSSVPGEQYSYNETDRVADLTMDDHGEVGGRVDITFKGAPALRWRQTALRGDEESVRHGLKTTLEDMLPKSLDVTVASISPLDDYEHPLKVTYRVNGTAGTPTGKRLVMPVDLFESGASAQFVQVKRENAVYFHYPQTVKDAVRVTFASGFTVEATPSDGKFGIPKQALYDIDTTSNPTSFTMHRTYVMADLIVLPADYPALKTFYSEFQGKDQESVVLKTTPATAATGN